MAIEEPLEIRINDQPVAVLMRTPGAEKELAVGFCFSEGLTADLAEHLNCTLIGYLRGQRMRVYTHAWRLER